MSKWNQAAVNRVQQGWNGEKLPADAPQEKKPRKNEEDRIQAAFCRAFAVMWPRLWDARRLHAIPNGGARNPVEGALKKRTGMRKGVWDLHLTIARGKYHGLWMECKAGSNGLTPEQIEFQEEHAADYAFAVFRTVEEGLKAVAEYLALPAVYCSISYER